MESPVTTAYVSTSPERKIQDGPGLWFLLQAHVPWIWNHYKPQIDQPQVLKKKCHFNRMEFTILFLRLPQNVSVLYKQKTHLTNIQLLSPNTRFKQWNQSSIKKNVPINSSSRWGLIASSGSHLLLVLLTLAGIDGGRAALMKFYPGTMSCPKLALLSLVMLSWKKMRIFCLIFFDVHLICVFFPWAKPKEILHLLKKAEQRKKNVATSPR